MNGRCVVDWSGAESACVASKDCRPENPSAAAGSPHKGVGELWHFRYTKREFPCGCVFIGSVCVYMYCTIYIHLYLPPLFFFYSDRRLETARPLFDSLSMRWRFIFSYLFIDVVATKFIISLAALLSRRRTPGKFNIH